jgi:hypothetical protein
MQLRITAKTEAAKGMVKALQSGFDPRGIDRIVEVVSLRSMTRLVHATPKKWTGALRRAWKLERPRMGVRWLVNRFKVMTFIEHGTANEGTGYIYPKHKRVLYLPLNKNAALGWSQDLVRGVDFILAARVRGIKPRHIARDEQKVVNRELFQTVRAGTIRLLDRATAKGGTSG